MRVPRRFASLAAISALCFACGSGGASGTGGSSGAGGSAGSGNGPPDAAGHADAPVSTDGGGGADVGQGGGEAGSSEGGTAEAGTFWTPSSSTPVHFHWELSTVFSAPRDVIPSDGQVVYDIDGQESDATTVAALHALGPNVKVVCYVDVGTLENFRPDAKDFPSSVVGNPVCGWPGENWLDVRQQSVLLPLMKNRFQTWCVDKGFDAVEPDNLDAWENSPGFPITEAENISYDLAIAALGHSMGLSMGLKNLPENAPTIEPNFDWALDEQCFQYMECSYFETSFIAKGKAVFDVEYNQSPNCTSATGAHLNAQKRDLNLVGPKASGYVYQPCIPDTQTTW
jgi:hypothetical protein